MRSISMNVWLAGLIRLIVCSANAGPHYLVPANTEAAPPFGSWASAGTSVIDVVNAAMADAVMPGTILVTNGVYLLTNTVAITNDVVMQSVNGRNTAIFNGVASYHFVMSNANCVLDGLTITNCYFNDKGGGILIYGGTVTNCLITSCANSSNMGAGISIGGIGNVLNSTISGNSNTHDFIQGGGGIAIGYYNTSGELGATGIVENCIIKNNTGLGNGGGIMIGTGLSYSKYVMAVVKNCLIVDNVATGASKYGGGIYIACTNVLVANCTIVSNYASHCGGGLAFDLPKDITNRVVNCIIVNNLFGNAGYASYKNIRKITGVTNAVAYSCSTPVNETFVINDGRGNTTADPGFINSAGGKYRFNRFSPCFNSGTNQISWMNSAVDLDGHPRILHGRVDMGAYELFIPGGAIFCFR